MHTEVSAFFSKFAWKKKEFQLTNLFQISWTKKKSQQPGHMTIRDPAFAAEKIYVKIFKIFTLIFEYQVVIYARINGKSLC